jgi:micrococcal nuclease
MKPSIRLFSLLMAIFCLALAPFWEGGESGKVIRIIDGDSFILDNNIVVRLAQIEAPRILNNDNQGQKSRDYLEKLILNQKVQLKYGGLRRDRLGRALAQVFIDKGLFDPPIWVNIEILKSGNARVRTYIDNRQNIGDFWQAEREARRNGRGLWQNPIYQARFATKPALIGAEGSFQLVEGRVQNIVQTPKVIKLIFGNNENQDFAALIPISSWDRFENGVAGIYKLQNLEIRVRGRIQGAVIARTSKSGREFMAHGPQIWLDHPEQIEYIMRK